MKEELLEMCKNNVIEGMMTHCYKMNRYREWIVQHDSQLLQYLRFQFRQAASFNVLISIQADFENRHFLKIPHSCHSMRSFLIRSQPLVQLGLWILRSLKSFSICEPFRWVDCLNDSSRWRFDCKRFYWNVCHLKQSCSCRWLKCEHWICPAQEFLTRAFYWAYT